MSDYKENLIRLRTEVAKSQTLGIVNFDLYALQMTQLLNTIETQRQNSAREMDSLREKIGAAQGRIRQCEVMADLLIETVAAHNRATERASEEIAAKEAERAEAAKEAEATKPKNGKRAHADQ